MKKILCVDDSATILIQLKNLLEPQGYVILQAYDGFGGLEMLKANNDVSLVICDVNMPELDGLSMCERVKNENLAPGVPIVMLTTETNSDLKARGKAAGVLGWITKPYNGEKLLLAVQKLTSSPAQRSAA